MPTPLRLQRIAGRISQELSVILIQESNDPRLAGVLITDVTVDRELAYADIYVSALEGKERSVEAIQGLEHAAPFLRRTLADRIELRVFPRLRFHWDPTPERADHIEKLLASLREDTTGSSKDKPANG